MANYKRIFIDGYSYFITIATHNRNPILIENIELLRKSFKISKDKYEYKIEAIVILPDHIHMIINPKNAKEYPHIIRTIKQYFSKHCEKHFYENIYQSNSRWREGYKPIWQKKYYEHTIRNENDFQEKMAYIYYNPVKHKLIDDAMCWEYSSFFTRRVDLSTIILSNKNIR